MIVLCFLVVSYVAGTSTLRQYDLGEQVASSGLWKIFTGG